MAFLRRFQLTGVEVYAWSKLSRFNWRGNRSGSPWQALRHAHIASCVVRVFNTHVRLIWAFPAVIRRQDERDGVCMNVSAYADLRVVSAVLASVRNCLKSPDRP